MGKQGAKIHANSATTPAHTAGEAPTLPGIGQASRSAPQFDSTLIVQIGQCDEQALGALYDRYGALVYTIAVRITQDRALAEMIVQAVFQAVWQSASSFQIGASVRVWLIGMARRRAIELAHSQGSRTRLRVVAHLLPDTIHPGEQGAADVETLIMQRALDRLPADQRETLELAHYDGLTCREIAAQLREPVGIIKARLRAGLCTLSEALSNAQPLL
jgi:RNA polymerase sigma-70 factor (ECF subfamily)